MSDVFLELSGCPAIGDEETRRRCPAKVVWLDLEIELLLAPSSPALPLASGRAFGMLDILVHIEEATMRFDANLEFVDNLFAAFGRGDIDHVIDAHADDIVSESPVSPYVDVAVGRDENRAAGTRRVLRDHRGTVRAEAFRDVRITAPRDRFVEGSNAGTVLGTGERYDRDWVMDGVHDPGRRGRAVPPFLWPRRHRSRRVTLDLLLSVGNVARIRPSCCLRRGGRLGGGGVEPRVSGFVVLGYR